MLLRRSAVRSRRRLWVLSRQTCARLMLFLPGSTASTPSRRTTTLRMRMTPTAIRPRIASQMTTPRARRSCTATRLSTRRRQRESRTRWPCAPHPRRASLQNLFGSVHSHVLAAVQRVSTNVELSELLTGDGGCHPGPEHRGMSPCRRCVCSALCAMMEYQYRCAHLIARFLVSRIAVWGVGRSIAVELVV